MYPWPVTVPTSDSGQLSVRAPSALVAPSWPGVSHMLQQTGSNSPICLQLTHLPPASTALHFLKALLKAPQEASSSLALPLLSFFLILSARWMLRVGQFFAVNTPVYYTMNSRISVSTYHMTEVFLIATQNVSRHCQMSPKGQNSLVQKCKGKEVAEGSHTSYSGRPLQTYPIHPFLQNQPSQQNPIALNQSPGEKPYHLGKGLCHLQPTSVPELGTWVLHPIRSTGYKAQFQKKKKIFKAQNKGWDGAGERMLD